MVGIIMTILAAAILGPVLVAELLRAAGLTKKSTPVIQLAIYGAVIAVFGGFVAVMWAGDQVAARDSDDLARRIASERVEEVRQARLAPAALQAVVAAEKVWGWDSGAPNEFATVKGYFPSSVFFQGKGEGAHYVSAEEQMISAVRSGGGNRPGLAKAALECLGTRDCIGRLAAADLPVFMQAASSLLGSIARTHRDAGAAACTITAFLMRNLVYVGAQGVTLGDVVSQLQSCTSLNGFNGVYLTRAQNARVAAQSFRQP